MKVSNSHVSYAAMKQLTREILKNTKGQNMKDLDTLAKFVAIKQLESEI